MPVEYDFDPLKPIYLITGSGVVTGEEMFALQEVLYSDERLPLTCPGILDLSSISRLDISAEQIERLAKRGTAEASRIGAGHFAIVAASESVYGLMRMFEILSEESPLTIHVFREMEEAKRWLELTPPE